jgi:predicted nucleic acid-binding protein
VAQAVRTPSPALVVDAAILVAAARGRSSAAVKKAAAKRLLMTTERAIQEAKRRIELGMKRPDLLAIVDTLTESIAVVPATDIESNLPESEHTLKEAVASRNGSTRDAHILALAWAVDADIWSSDRDFAGTGVATWSTPNLMRGLAAG